MAGADGGIDLYERSGIDKTICTGPVNVTSLGIEGDEHDLTFHGGVDKAIHGYCKTHYPSWAAEFPSAADSFRPGGFGENLVFARMNERNVCIGDIVSLGGEGGLLLQVSLPRQPCFKLNHRFSLRNFAPNTWRTSRTGWYYRVLRPGPLAAGDEARLVERPHPDWPLERVQEFLHRRPDEWAMVRRLAAIDEFGAECKSAFRGRIARHEAQERRAALAAAERGLWRDFALVRRTRQTPRVVALEFAAVKPDAAAEGLDPGAHVKIKLANGLVRAYSVVGGDRNRFELGVALEEKSKGGSRFLHETLEVGHTVQVGKFTNAIGFAGMASNHIFVAGGVGLTAFLPLIEAMHAINWSCRLHYAVRCGEEIPFRERLAKLGGDVVTVYDKSQGQRMDIAAIVKGMSWNSALAFCGPKRLMDEALRVTKAAGLGDGDNVHFEAFEADVSGDPFDVLVANRGDGEGGEGVALQVGGEETLLEVLKRRFGEEEVASSCEVGNCGTCKLTVRSGRVEHRGTALTEEEKEKSMLSCVSRGIGCIAIEI